MKGARKLMGPALLACALGCETSDVGTDCPMDDLNAGTEEAPTSSPEVVEINTLFPCASLTCVSTDGRAAYCSRECRRDSNCPPAFNCEQVISTGPLSDRSYCIWRNCKVDFECGDVNTYACERDETSTTQEGKCTFKE